jgi:type IV pilus assembly protein PilE
MQVQKNTAFTLLELMITITIMGVIASWAIPSYQEYIMASHRSDAKSSLLELQLEQEKWRASHVSYATLDELGMAKTTANGYYNLSIKNTPDSEQFLAIARPIGSQINDLCKVFAINQLGAMYKGYADKNCWDN